jgi:hypothetical protein
MHLPPSYLKLACALSLLLPTVMRAQQPGDFDPVFGIDGIGQIFLPTQLDFSESSFAISRDPSGAFRIAFTTQQQGNGGTQLHTVQMFDSGGQNPAYGTSGIQSISVDTEFPCKLTGFRNIVGATSLSTAAGLVASLQHEESAELVILKNGGVLHAKHLHPDTRILGLHSANTVEVMAFGSKQEDAGRVGFVDNYKIADGAALSSAFPKLTPAFLGHEGEVSSGEWFSEVAAITSYSFIVGSRLNTRHLALGTARFPTGERKLIVQQQAPVFPAQGNSLVTLDLPSLDESVPAAVNTDAVREHLVHMEAPQGGGSATRLWHSGERDTEFSLPQDYLPPRTETGLLEDRLLRSIVSHGSHYMQVRKQKRTDGGLQLQLVRFDWAGNPDTTLGPDGKKIVLLNSLHSIDAAIPFGNHLYLVGTRLQSSQRQIVVLKMLLQNPLPDPPSIVIQNAPSPQIIDVGGVAEFSMTATQSATTPQVPLRYYLNFGTERSQTKLDGNLVLGHDGMLSNSRPRVLAMSMGATDGIKTVTSPLAVTMRRPPYLSSPMQSSYQVLRGQFLAINPAMNGGTPYHSQWVKVGSGTSLNVPIVPENEPNPPRQSFLITSAKPQDAGIYEFQFSNPDGVSQVYQTEIVVLNDPTITSTSGNQLAAVGEQTALWAVAISGYPTIKNTWKKNGKAIPSDSEGNIEYMAVQVRNAGTYQVTARSAAGVARAEAMELAVVDTSPKFQVGKLGARTSLRLSAAGKGVQYEWFKGDQSLVGSARHQGATAKNLLFSALEANDQGLYTCRVTGHGRILNVPFELILVDAKPELTPLTLPSARVAHGYQAQLAVTPAANLFAVTGLPKGMKVHKQTGQISGVPRRAGTYRLQVVAVNPVGRSKSQRFDLEVLPLAASMRGRLHRSDDITQTPHFGAFTVFVSPSGAVTAKVPFSNLQGKRHTLRHRGTFHQDPVYQNALITGHRSAAIPKSSGYRGSDNLILDEAGVAWEIGLVGPHDEELYEAYLTGSSCPKQQDSEFAGTYNLAAVDHQATSEDEPSSYSYARVRISQSGAMTLAATLSDGSRLTHAQYVSPQGMAMLGTFLYQNQGLHSMRLTFAQHASGSPERRFATANALWSRTATQAPTRSNDYPNGFSQRPQWSGSIYLPPGEADRGPLLFDAPERPNNLFGNLTTDSSSNRSTVANLTRNHTASSIDPGPDYSDRIASTRFHPRTGAFQGVWIWNELNDLTGNLTLRRKIPFKGLVVHDHQSTAIQGLGHGNLPAETTYSNKNGQTIQKSVSRSCSIRLGID